MSYHHHHIQNSVELTMVCRLPGLVVPRITCLWALLRLDKLLLLSIIPAAIQDKGKLISEAHGCRKLTVSSDDHPHPRSVRPQSSKSIPIRPFGPHHSYQRARRAFPRIFIFETPQSMYRPARRTNGRSPSSIVLNFRLRGRRRLQADSHACNGGSG